MDVLSAIGTNKIFIGCAMLIMNLGSKYVAADLGPSHEKILKNELFKKVILFCMVFIATRDIMTSIILTFAFTVVVNGLLNENSKFNLLWKSKK